MPQTIDRLVQSTPKRGLVGTRLLPVIIGLTALFFTIFAVRRWQATATGPTLSAAEIARLQAKAPARMALIPAGNCWLGSDDEDADDDLRPRRRVYVPSFYMDRYEVTNAEFRRFDPKHMFAAGQENYPVTGVVYDESAAYAKWAGKRLPTEAEWEKAARGTDARRYPWGDRWDAANVAQKVKKAAQATPPKIAPAISIQATSKSCYVGPSRMRPVGSVPSGVSPYGCYDMAGNAWEWVQGVYNGNANQRLLRGGAVGYGERACRTYQHAIEGASDT